LSRPHVKLIAVNKNANKIPGEAESSVALAPANIKARRYDYFSAIWFQWWSSPARAQSIMAIAMQHSIHPPSSLAGENV
jgi:hypothetical protein